MNNIINDNNCEFVREYLVAGEIKSVFYHHKCDTEYHIAKKSNEISVPCQRCTYFDKKIKKDAFVRRKLDEATSGVFYYMGLGYKDNKTPLIIKNNKTGDFFLNNNLDNIINKNNKDPYESMSKYEKMFFNFMKHLNINTNPYEILSLKKNELIRVDKKSQPLRLDFTLNLLSRPVIAFEIDSGHHFQEIFYFDSYSTLKKRIKRDLRKDLHVTSNLLPLVRLTPTACQTKYNSYNVIEINGESFLAKVISHPEIFKRNISLIKEIYKDKYRVSDDFDLFLDKINDISTRTNPFN